jgi:hypothetical protein
MPPNTQVFVANDYSTEEDARQEHHDIIEMLEEHYGARSATTSPENLEVGQAEGLGGVVSDGEDALDGFDPLRTMRSPFESSRSETYNRTGV